MSEVTRWPFVPLCLVPLHPDVLIEFRDGFYFAHTSFLGVGQQGWSSYRTARCRSWVEAYNAIAEAHPGVRRPSSENEGRFWLEGKLEHACTSDQCGD